MIATSFTESSFGAGSARRGGTRARPGARDADLQPRAAGAGWPFKVGLCMPMGGAAGIWGPSCLASAQLAEFELNRAAGVAGRPCELVLIDASDESPDVEATVLDLVDEGGVDALVGMCISSVRERIVGAVGGRVPFVYTCLHEGGAAAPGLFTIGETAPRQLQPSIAWLARHRGPQRWMLVGNDYIWPRVSHCIARQCIAASGAEVVAETFLPFGVADYTEVLAQLRRTRADAVLISMVGQDAVEFNRAFGRAGLADQALRLSCAIEENQLLAIGAANTERLHVALGYFGALQTDANLAFKERYHSHFGDRAPTLNSIGQSLYEGMHFLSAMFAGAGSPPRAPLTYPSARRASGAGVEASAPIYLAAADGHMFRVIDRL